MQRQPYSKLLSTEEVAGMLGLSPNTLRFDRTQRQSKIPFVKIGRSVRYYTHDVEAYLATLSSHISSREYAKAPHIEKPTDVASGARRWKLLDDDDIEVPDNLTEEEKAEIGRRIDAGETTGVL